jgi:hypothetical protein
MRRRPSARSAFAWLVCAAVPGVVALARPAAAATFLVGTDPACTHDSLERALAAAAANGPESDDIRIGLASYTLNNRLEIADQSLRLLGGFASCSAAASSGRTTLQRSGSSEAFWLRGGTAQRTFELHGVDVSMGAGARALLLQGWNRVRLVRSDLVGGRAPDGGNVYMTGPLVELELTDADIVNGQASGATNGTGFGGGIYCELGGSVFVGAGSSVHGNNARISGGGIYAEGCAVTSTAGGPPAAAPPLLGGIYQNVAQLGGGAGIYATAGATLLLQGSSADDLAYVTSNQSTPGGDGGGIYLIGAGTTATLRNAVIADNSSAHYGGGIYLAAGAVLDMAVDASQCPAGRGCSRLSGNWAGGGYGGGVSVASGGVASIRQTRIQGNYNRGGLPGSAASISGEGSVLLVEGCEIVANRPPAGSGFTDTSRIYAATTSTGTIAFSTLIETSASGGSALLEIQPASTFKLLSSIVQAPKTFQAPAVASRIDCVLTRESSSFPGGSTHVAVVTNPAPLFENYAAGDYRLSATSAARDYCNTQFYSPIGADLDNQGRGADDPSVANLGGPYDLGADEVLVKMFSDGFDPGNTDNWSLAVP